MQKKVKQNQPTTVDVGLSDNRLFSSNEQRDAINAHLPAIRVMCLRNGLPVRRLGASLIIFQGRETRK